MKTIWLWLICGLILVGCHNKEKLRVAATSVPHAEMLEAIKPDLKEKGIDLEIVEVDDYQLPNRLLAEKQVDANFFQHTPFLNASKKHYGNMLVVLKEIHYEPLGLYSKKITSVDQLKSGSVIAIPCDPANETRALHMLASLNLIEIKQDSPFLTVQDINSKSLNIKEIDSPLLPRLLPDVDAAIIPANFALQAHLAPNQDALALEKESGYPNVLVIRAGDEGREDLQELARALTSEKMKTFLCEKYKGAIQPLF